MRSKKTFKIKPDYVWKAQEMVWFVFSDKEKAEQFSSYLAEDHKLKGSDKKSNRKAWENASKYTVKVTPKEYDMLRMSADTTLPDQNELLPAYNSSYVSEQINSTLSKEKVKVKAVDVDVKVRSTSDEPSKGMNFEPSDVARRPIWVCTATLRMDSALDDENTRAIMALIQSCGNSMSVKRGNTTIAITVNSQELFEELMNNLSKKVEGLAPTKK